MRWIAAVAVLVFGLVTLPASFARGHDHECCPPCPPTVGRLVELEVIGDDRGSLPIRENWSRWDHRSSPELSGTIEAVRGERYSLRVRNRTGGRVGLVIAVDGRNIVNGQRSSLRSAEGMYVLDPWTSGTFRGWRSGYDRENRFYFTDEADSYAGRWGDSSQLGVIAVAVFREQRLFARPYPMEPYYDEKSRRSSAAPSPGKPSLQSEVDRSESGPGTGYGEGVFSPVQGIDFTTEPFAAERYAIRYEWASPPRWRYDEDHPSWRFTPQNEGRHPSQQFTPPPPPR